MQIWESGSLGVPDTPFEVLFEKNLLRPLRASLSSLRSTPELILVPSLRDAHHHTVYPQPPYDTSVCAFSSAAENHRSTRPRPDPLTRYSREANSGDFTWWPTRALCVSMALP